MGRSYILKSCNYRRESTGLYLTCLKGLNRVKEICTCSLAAPETYCWHFKVLDARKGVIQEINFNSKIRLLIIWKTILRKFFTNIRSLFIFLGVEVITVVCVRDDDQSAVGDQFCEEKRPEDITKECNIQACPARWDHKRLISVWRLGVIWLKYYWYWPHTNLAWTPRGGILAQCPYKDDRESIFPMQQGSNKPG